MTIPKDLDEAALDDGAGFFRIYAGIMLPLIVPALVVVGLFSFLNGWNDFMGPLIYLSDEKLYTLATISPRERTETRSIDGKIFKCYAFY